MAAYPFPFRAFRMQRINMSGYDITTNAKTGKCISALGLFGFSIYFFITLGAFWEGFREYEAKYHVYLQGQIGNPEGDDKPDKKYNDPV